MPEQGVNQRWVHRAAAVVAAGTFALIVAGGLVTSTGSGLAVPDWPLAFGQVFPRMEGGVLFEHGHRLIAATVGVLTIHLVVVTQRLEPRAPIRRAAWLALALIVLQGVLGGVTVLLHLPTAVSVAHAGLAQVFFSVVVGLAVVTAPRWRAARPTEVSPEASLTLSLAVAVVLATYAQSVLGAVVRHSGAGLAIPDFPLNFGRLVPPFTSALVAYQFAHRVGAVVVAALILWTAIRIFRRHGADPYLARPSLLLVALLGWQVFLGALTVWARKAVIPTTAHVATGALLLVTAVTLALRAGRVLQPSERALVPQVAP